MIDIDLENLAHHLASCKLGLAGSMELSKQEFI